MTATVNNLLVGKNIIEGKKDLAPKKTKTSEKRLGQLKSKSDKKAAKEAAPKEVVEEVKEEEIAAEIETTPEA